MSNSPSKPELDINQNISLDFLILHFSPLEPLIPAGLAGGSAASIGSTAASTPDTDLTSQLVRDVEYD